MNSVSLGKLARVDRRPPNARRHENAAEMWERYQALFKELRSQGLSKNRARDQVKEQMSRDGVAELISGDPEYISPETLRKWLND